MFAGRRRHKIFPGREMGRPTLAKSARMGQPGLAWLPVKDSEGCAPRPAPMLCVVVPWGSPNPSQPSTAKPPKKVSVKSQMRCHCSGKCRMFLHVKRFDGRSVVLQFASGLPVIQE